MDQQQSLEEIQQQECNSQVLSSDASCPPISSSLSTRCDNNDNDDDNDDDDDDDHTRRKDESDMKSTNNPHITNLLHPPNQLSLQNQQSTLPLHKPPKPFDSTASTTTTTTKITPWNEEESHRLQRLLNGFFQDDDDDTDDKEDEHDVNDKMEIQVVSSTRRKLEQYLEESDEDQIITITTTTLLQKQKQQSSLKSIPTKHVWNYSSSLDSIRNCSSRNIIVVLWILVLACVIIHSWLIRPKHQPTGTNYNNENCNDHSSQRIKEKIHARVSSEERIQIQGGATATATTTATTTNVSDTINVMAETQQIQNKTEYSKIFPSTATGSQVSIDSSPVSSSPRRSSTNSANSKLPSLLLGGNNEQVETTVQTVQTESIAIESSSDHIKTLSPKFQQSLSIHQQHSWTVSTPPKTTTTTTTSSSLSSSLYSSSIDTPSTTSTTTSTTTKHSSLVSMERTRQDAQSFSQAVQEAKHALHECGSSPSLAPILAFLQQSRQQQEEFEKKRLAWDWNQKILDRQLSERQHSETVAAFKYDPNWMEKLAKCRGTCWNTVSRLLLEVGMMHRLHEILRPWRNQSWRIVHNTSPRVWMQAVAAMACDCQPSDGTIVSETNSWSFFSVDLFSSATNWIAIDSLIRPGLCYTYCFMFYGIILLLALLVHQVLRAFSAPTAIHNVVNLGGVLLFYCHSNVIVVLDYWPFWMVVCSTGSLFVLVQWQFLQVRSHINCAGTNSFEDTFHSGMKRFENLFYAISLLRYCVVAMYATWWLWDEKKSVGLHSFTMT